MDTHPKTPAPGPAPPPAVAAPADGLPPPVDLSKCDRDLDLFGVVVDGKDAPVPGARVGTLRRLWRRLSGPNFPRYEEAVPGPATRSARDGTFSLRLERNEAVDLLVQADSFVDSLLAACPSGGRFRVVLREGARVEVTAKDGEGRPVAGVRVHLIQKPAGPRPSSDRRGTTDAAGRCVLAGVPAGRAILLADHDALGSPHAELPQVPESGVLAVDLRMGPERTVSGRVTDAATGKPIPRAEVAADPFYLRSVATDDEGRYRFTPWPPSSGSELFARAPGHSGATAPVPPRGDAPVDFALSTGETVTGRLLGRPGDAPVAGAPVLVLGRGIQPTGGRTVDILDAVSGTDGRFSISGVHREFSHVIAIAAPGHGRLDLNLDPAEGDSGFRDLGDLPLPEPRTIAGVFVDAHGDPIPGREVSLSAAGGGQAPGTAPPESRWTDDLGRFVFPDLDAGNYRLQSYAEGTTPVRLDVRVTTEDGRVDVRLEASAGAARSGSLEVRVVDPSGKPVEGVYVLGLVEGGTPVQRRTDAEGRAELVNLATPRIRVQVTPQRTVSQPSRFLPPEPLEAAVGGPPVVVRLAEAASLGGRVVGPDGRPLPGMSVNAKGPGKSWSGATTGEKGEFSLSMAGGVPFLVEIGGWRQKDDGSGQSERTNLRCEPRELIAPAEGIVFNMHEIPGGRTLTVRVVDLEGKPIPGCGVISPAPTKDNSFPGTDRDGRVTLEGLFEEEIRVHACQPGGRIYESSLPEGTVMPAPVTVIPRGQEITLRLRKGEPRTGIVRDPEGRPVEKAAVTIQTDDYVTSQVWTRADGTFTTWVSPGAKLMRATASTFSPAGPPMVADLEKDSVPQEGEIVLTLQPRKPDR